MTVVEAPIRSRSLPPLPVDVEVPDNLDGLGDSYELELALYDGEQEVAREPIRVTGWPPLMVRGEAHFGGPLHANRWAAFAKGERFAGPSPLETTVDLGQRDGLTVGILLRRPW